MYNYELEQKEKINNRITIPMAIITLLIGLAVFYFKNLDDIGTNIWGYAFFVIYGIYVLLILVTICLIFRAYYNYEYAYIPSPDVVEADIKKIIRYYDENYEQYFKEKGPKQDLIEQDIENMISEYYKKSINRNIPMNEKKLKLLRYTGNTLLLALCFAAVSIIPYQIAYKETKEIKIKIEQFDDLNKLINEGVKKLNQNNTNNEDKTSTPPPKPEVSEPRVVQEGFDVRNLDNNQ